MGRGVGQESRQDFLQPSCWVSAFAARVGRNGLAERTKPSHLLPTLFVRTHSSSSPTPWCRGFVRSLAGRRQTGSGRIQPGWDGQRLCSFARFARRLEARTSPGQSLNADRRVIATACTAPGQSLCRGRSKGRQGEVRSRAGAGFAGLHSGGGGGGRGSRFRQRRGPSLAVAVPC